MLRNKIIILAFTVGLFSCQKENLSLIPTNNEGGYTIELSQTNTNDSIYIYGEVKTIDDKEPLISSQINVACSEFYTDENGKYSFKVSKSVFNNYSLRIRYFGYKTIDTEFLPKADTLKVDVYLQLFDSPLYNCD